MTYYGDYVADILKVIEKSEIGPKIKIEILIQLYRFTYYCDAFFAIDPRVDNMFKNDILYRMENEVASGKANKVYLKELKESIDELQHHVDNPLEMIDCNIKFFTEHPGAIF